MEKFTQMSAQVVAIPFANVDTDIIMPKEFLKSIQRTGFGEHVFNAWRDRADFDFFKPEFKQAKIILAGENFGCGSSREHAVWGLKEAGIRAIIAPSFAEIFFNNCIKNGLLPIALEKSLQENLLKQYQSQQPFSLSIDLLNNQLATPSGDTIMFELDASSKKRLVEGLDDIALTLTFKDKILAFEKQRMQQAPWIYQ